MNQVLYGSIFAFVIGLVCGWLRITPPAPTTIGPVIVLAALVVGYIVARGAL